MSVRRMIVPLCAMVLGVGLVSTPARSEGLAQSRATMAGQEQVFERGTVRYVQDGDTIQVNLSGGGIGVVRLTGVQSPEKAQPAVGWPKDQCGAEQASQALRSMLPVGTKVELRGQHRSSRSRGRLLRTVIAMDKSGQYTIDVQQELARLGLVLWWPDIREQANRRADLMAVMDAVEARRNLWSTDLCGTGPYPKAQIELTVVWDAPGNDNQNPNGEKVIIKNRGAERIQLRGWTLRDSNVDWLDLPAGTVLEPHSRLTVKVGKGRDTRRVLHWNSSTARFPNARSDRLVGDGAYLMDPRGNTRSYFMYPCLRHCSEPALGNVTISKVMYDPKGRDTRGREYVRLTNSSDREFRLEAYYLAKGDLHLVLPRQAVIPPRSSIRVYNGPSKSPRSRINLGPAGTRWPRSGVVRLISPHAVVLSCQAWGDGRC